MKKKMKELERRIEVLENQVAAGTATKHKNSTLIDNEELETAIQTLNEAKLPIKFSMARRKVIQGIRKLLEERV